MDAIALIARIRDHYVEQFKAFIDHQQQSCTRGAPEVKLQLSDASRVYRHLYRVDFIRNAGQSEVVELQPENILTFDTISASFGSMALSIEHLRWDDVVIHHDLAALPVDDVGRWFERWLDPDDDHHNPEVRLSSVIHSLLVEPTAVSIDFGTAPPDAFWDILAILDRAGAATIRIASSKAEAALNAGGAT